MKAPFFAVLGGMGTLATESYIRVLNARTRAHRDQDYLDYVVFNDASVPDRTAFITHESSENPFPVIADDIAKATAIGASFIVLTCNTAHYFYDEFQALTNVPLLHMPHGAVAWAAVRWQPASHPRMGFLGTEGSRIAGVYQREIEQAGYTFIEPQAELQRAVDSLIYDDVKGGKPLSHETQEKYRAVIDAMLDPQGAYRCDAVLLGCTELSVLNETFPLPDMPLIDAQAVLVDDTIQRAEALRQGR